MFEKEIAKSLAKVTKLKESEIESLIEIPPNSEMGDYAFPCFILAKKLKKNPAEIAKDLSSKIKIKSINKVETKGPYLNFFVNKEAFMKQALKNAGKIKKVEKGTIVIDMSSPNIAKPFGIGHLRSTIIGNSISKISKALGLKIVKINYLGDWGTQFGKMIVGYKRFGSDEKLKESPIDELLRIYVKANNEKYEDEAREWFQKMEQGDKEALQLWKKFKDLSIKEFNEIYKLLGVKFNEISGESKYNDKLDSVIKQLEKKKLLKVSQDARIVDLEKYKLGISLIQKKDGASLYATRDIATAIKRQSKYKFTRMFYEVGTEQKLHFKQVFKILELLGYKWAKDLVHIDHGLYLGKDNKKFATRKGKVIYMKDVWNEVYEKVLANLTKKSKSKLSLKQLDKNAILITRAAINYADLSNHRSKDSVFDIEKMTKFEGNTGPYLLYSYARASSILRKSKKKPSTTIPIEIQNKEIALAKKIAKLQKITEDAYKILAPNLIANYAYELADVFNEFYHDTKVLGTQEEPYRLLLIKAFRETIKTTLSLLGIEVLEEM
jgi:arginyl-tRNA synthetase